MILKDIPAAFFADLGKEVDIRKHPKDPKDITWNCDHDLRRAKKVAKKHSLTWEQIEFLLRQNL